MLIVLLYCYYYWLYCCLYCSSRCHLSITLHRKQYDLAYIYISLEIVLLLSLLVTVSVRPIKLQDNTTTIILISLWYSLLLISVGCYLSLYRCWWCRWYWVWERFGKVLEKFWGGFGGTYARLIFVCFSAYFDVSLSLCQYQFVLVVSWKCNTK